VVDEDAGQLVTDSALHQGGCDRGVDAAGQAAQHALVPDGRADPLNLLGHDVGHRPGRATAGRLDEELAEHLLAVLGVHDLGVELHAVQAACRVLEGGNRSRRSRCSHEEPGWGFRHGVAVRHPDRLLNR